MLFQLTALSLALCVTVPAQSAPKPAAAPQTQALVIELAIPASLPEVWTAFTTKPGLQTWLAPDVTVDLRPGGDWLVHFGPSTGGGTIVSFIPQQELVISALAPDQFPHVRAARTRAAFRFTSCGDSCTTVRLIQTGWQSGPEWDAAYEYLASGNAQLLAALHRRFTSGPIDWQKAFAPSKPK